MAVTDTLRRRASAVKSQVRRMRTLAFVVTSWNAGRRGAARGLPGVVFGRYGRSLGWRMRRQGLPVWFSYVVTPVNCVRYFEFAFALETISRSPASSYLDVGSPRLLSLFVAEHDPQARIRVINPDLRDSRETAEIASALGIRGLEVESLRVEELRGQPQRYDCIWCLSVVEHIPGPEGDRDAVRVMYDLLADGGSLVLTFPVDRTMWLEYRAQDVYGLSQEQAAGGEYFFQRFYDAGAIEERLLGSPGSRAAVMRWYGETTPGWFAEYEQRWMQQGDSCTAQDPIAMAENFREYASWGDMPGMGVCGMIIKKPQPTSNRLARSDVDSLVTPTS